MRTAAMSRANSPSRFEANAVTERLLKWREEALRYGRQSKADRLLLLAWFVYDQAWGGAPPDGTEDPPKRR